VAWWLKRLGPARVRASVPPTVSINKKMTQSMRITPYGFIGRNCLTLQSALRAGLSTSVDRVVLPWGSGVMSEEI
jgi:hypothetical protein